MKIVHVSDIHIRNTSRHEEYKTVFDRLERKIAEEKPDRIYIGGDIFHSKSVTSPESVFMAYEFLNNLANFAPVDVIIGNHDTNLNNENRMDCNTPIATFINEKYSPSHIHLYKDSGLYEISDNITYGVFSIIDKANWPIEFERKPGMVYIALFHAAIFNSRITDHINIDDKSYGLELFKNYDFGMLGDIHLRQGFVARSHQTPSGESKTSTTIDYSGSLIQQSPTEDLDKGFLVWDIISRDVFDKRFIKVENDYGFYNASFDSMDEFNNHDYSAVPKKPYIKLTFTNKITDAEKSEVEAQITKNFNPLTLNVVVSDPKNNKKNVISDVESIANIWSLETQNKLINKFVMNKYPNTSSETNESINKLHKKYYDTNINDISYINNSTNRWDVERFEFDNLFAYKEGNVIDFTNIAGTIGLFAPNKSGKSSVIDAILWTIFNKTTKTRIKNEDILNKMKTSGGASITINYGNKKYCIERTMDKKTKTLKNSVTIYEIDETGTKHVINDESRTSTDSNVIRPLFGELKDILVTSFASQFGHRQFIEMDNSQRKTLLTRLLGIENIQKIYDVANKDYKNLKATFNAMKPVETYDKLEEYKVSYKQYIKNVKEYKLTLEQKTKDLERAKLEYEQLKTKIDELQDENNTVELETLQKEYEALKVLIQNNTNAYNEYSAKIGETLTEITKLSEYFESFNGLTIPELLKKANDDRVINEQIENIKIQIDKLTKEINQVIKNSEFFESSRDLFVGNKCTQCSYFYNNVNIDKQKFSQYDVIDESVYSLITIDACGDKDSLLETKRKLEESLGELVENVTISQGDYNLIVKNSNNLVDLTSKLELLQSNYNNCEQLSKAYGNQLNSLEEFLKANEARIGEIANISLLKQGLDIKQREYNSLQKEVASIGDMINADYGAAMKIEGIVEVLKENSKEIDRLAAEIYDYELYLEAIHRDGIPSDIIKLVLPIVNEEVNDILSSFSIDFNAYIEYDEEKEEIEVYISDALDQKDKRRIETGSGAEQIITSIVMRIAFSNVSAMPISSLFVVDEGFGALDYTNITSLQPLFLILKKYYKNVLIVSHLDTIQDMVEHQLSIKEHRVMDSTGVERRFSTINNVLD